MSFPTSVFQKIPTEIVNASKLVGFGNNVTTATISCCIKILENYGVLRTVKSDLLPLKITFLCQQYGETPVNIRDDTIHWSLWVELNNNRQRNNGNNDINVFIFQLTQKLEISSKQLTKSLQYLKSKNLIIYESLRRSGAIILLTRDYESKLNWNEIEMNREIALMNEKKMKELTETNDCRRQLLLKYFDQNYRIGSNSRCCDNCNFYI